MTAAFNTIKVTHAVANVEVLILPVNLIGFYFSQAANATILVSTGTATIPVKETTSEIEMLLQRLQSNSPVTGGVLPSAFVDEALVPIR